MSRQGDTSAGRRRARRTWRSRVSSVQVRLLLCTGIVLGFGAVGTSAYWTDQASVEIGPISSGTLDLQLGPNTATSLLAGQGGTWEFAVVQLDDVLPGESVAMDIHFKNGGTTPLKFTGTGWTTTDSFLGNLAVTTKPNATARNDVGSRAAGNRVGNCDGGTGTWWSNHPISTAPLAITPANAPITLQPGTELRVCMLVTFSLAAPNTLQNAHTTIKATFNAVQP